MEWTTRKCNCIRHLGIVGEMLTLFASPKQTNVAQWLPECLFTFLSRVCSHVHVQLSQQNNWIYLFLVKQKAIQNNYIIVIGSHAVFCVICRSRAVKSREYYILI